MVIFLYEDRGTYRITYHDDFAMPATFNSIDQYEINFLSGKGLNALKLYPNPAKDILNVNINLKIESKVSMYLFGITGNQISKLYSGDFKLMNRIIKYLYQRNWRMGPTFLNSRLATMNFTGKYKFSDCTNDKD